MTSHSEITTATMTAPESASSQDGFQQIMRRFAILEETLQQHQTTLEALAQQQQHPAAAATAEPVVIPRAPTTAPTVRSTATCKPPKEPTLTGDKQYEWQEFEREFLRYFRITQGYYMEPEVQVDLLLATAGEKVRKVFYQLALPAEDAKDLEKVITAIRQQFSQQQSTVVNKYLFMKIRRDAGEELDSFVTRLRESARRCAFADEDQRVLEQLIFSTIDNVEVLRRMVKDSPPTLNEVIRILKADEVASLEMDRMVGKAASVHAVRNENQQHRGNDNTDRPRARLVRGGNCDNCIFTHSSGRDQCPAKAMECFFCKKSGHMIAKCKKRLSAEDHQYASSSQNGYPRNNSNRSGQRFNKRVHGVEPVEDADGSDAESVAVDSVFVGNINGDNKDSWQTAIRIGNKMVNCKIDTGAEVNVMPERVYLQLREKPRLAATKTVLRTVAGQVKPIGVIETSAQFKEKRSVAKFFIVSDNSPTLCGLQTSVELGLVRKLFQ